MCQSGLKGFSMMRWADNVRLTILGGQGAPSSNRAEAVYSGLACSVDAADRRKNLSHGGFPRWFRGVAKHQPRK
jgi:hypothetical protein